MRVREPVRPALPRTRARAFALADTHKYRILGQSACSRQLKLDRIREGNPPRTLDLFSGCGGISLGFKTAGFDIAAAIELDPTAAASHALNFHQTLPTPLQQLHAQSRDITRTEPDDLLFGLDFHGDITTCVDVLVGGPPCQSFARVGRAKLREIAEHPEAFMQDPRSNLYLRYLHYVAILHPLAILIENVPDVLNYGGHNIAQEVCEVLSEMGYVCKYTLLNAAYYGVPQMRERMFLIAYAPELNVDVTFPAPTHWIDLPAGYEGARQVALKPLMPTLFNTGTNIDFLPPPVPASNLHPAVTAEEALGDLPRITIHLDGHLRRGTRRFDQLIPYPDVSLISEYAESMRNWPGYENREGISDHVIRSLPRDYAIFRRMNPGDQYPEAHEHALALFREQLDALAAEGKNLVPGSSEYEQLFRAIVPPYDTRKFPNKWRKMEPDYPARTLMAHLGKDGYSHIHYDSSQARTISVREAARLQSFPDGFHFCGAMNAAFRQIGNAVPPQLALTIAKTIMASLKGE